MGAQFRLEHANIMAYVTSWASAPPRLLRDDLREFLLMLAYNPREYLIPERHFENWPDEISTVARTALEQVGDQREETVAPASVERVLTPLRSEFADYPLYALAVGGGERLRQQAHQLAELPLYGQMLVLIPLPPQEGSQRNFEVLDPVPVFSRALHSLRQWPGFLFWTTSGVSTFASSDAVDELVQELRRVPEEPRARRRPWPEFGNVGRFDDVIRRHASAGRAPSRRLLHISDLHFGTNHALENQSLLEAELRDVVKTVDRVVITGDLIDSPKPEYATMFTTFKNNLTHVARGREPIVVPGNHDQRVLGNVGRDFEQVAGMGSRRVVVDDDSEMVFVGFNSSERGSFARGKIPASQFRSLGGEYRTQLAARQELKRYLPLVLVHHHPFSFDVAPETRVQKALRMFGLREESFLAMVNASDLHTWCADWDIRTILHGHKHKARYVERSVRRSDQTEVNLTAIGCGSSLGAEGSPVSYNVLDWEPSLQRWVASIYESVNGGAFRERLATVSPDP